MQTNTDSLSASIEIPRSRERERMSAGQLRVVGEKQTNAERVEVRFRESVAIDDHWQFPRRRPRPATVFAPRPLSFRKLLPETLNPYPA